MIPRRATCRACGWPGLTTVLDLGTLAYCGTFPRPGESVPEGPLELVTCDSCELAQSAHEYPLTDLYGPSYGYRSGLNPTMVAHLRAIARAAWHTARPRPDEIVVDIGANDGTLLGGYPSTTQRWAIDPLAEKFGAHYPPGVTRVLGFAGPTSLPFRDVAIVTSIACFYDLPDPAGTAQAIADMLRPGGVWVVEVADLHAMVDQLAFDQIVHEHVEYYRADDVIMLALRAGLSLIALQRNDINGGSVLLGFQKPPKTWEDVELPACPAIDWPTFGDRIRAAVVALRAFLTAERSGGRRVIGYGASTKGNVLLQLAAVTPEALPEILDANPEKDGCVTPGTGIPIRVQRDPLPPGIAESVLVLPWHFRDFIVEKERAYLEAGGRLVFPLPRFDIVTARDLAQGAA